jgi:amidase
MKPSAGRIPNDDQPSVTDDIAHHGLLTRSTDDLVRGMSVAFGPDRIDPRSLRLPPAALDPAAAVAGLRVAVSPDLGFCEVEPQVAERLEAAAAALADAGAVVTHAEPDWNWEMAEGWIRHWSVHLAAFYGADLERVQAEVDPPLWSIIEQGRRYSAVELKADELLRTRQWRRMAAFWESADVLLTPAMSRTAVPVGEDEARYYHVTPQGRLHSLDLTAMFNWVPWCPALSVPAGQAPDGLPVGAHIAAQPYRDDVAIAAARVIEAAFGVPAPPEP